MLHFSYDEKDKDDCNKQLGIFVKPYFKTIKFCNQNNMLYWRVYKQRKQWNGTIA